MFRNVSSLLLLIFVSDGDATAQVKQFCYWHYISVDFGLWIILVESKIDSGLFLLQDCEL